MIAPYYSKISEKLYTFNFIGTKWNLTYSKSDGELFIYYDDGLIITEYIGVDLSFVDFIVKCKVLLMQEFINKN